MDFTSVPEAKIKAKVSWGLIFVIVVALIIGTVFGTKYFMKVDESVNRDLQQQVIIMDNDGRLNIQEGKTEELMSEIYEQKLIIADLRRRLSHREENCKCR